MKENRERYRLSKMVKIFGVSRSGYYAFEKREISQHKKNDTELSKQIKQIFNEHYRRYGSPRVWEELKSLGWRVSRKRIERLMRELGLKARRLRKWVKTTDSAHNLRISENHLNRNFQALNPGEKWVSDITYLGSNSGWLYMTVILDLWDRKVIGWSISEDLTANAVCRALKMAILNRQPKEGIIFHSDQGVQYCSEEFRSTLKKLCPTARQSMSRKGNCWDNACAESFFGTLKAELLELGRRYTKSQIKTAVFEYIEVYYNRSRRHSTLGYVTPVALENNIAA